MAPKNHAENFVYETLDAESKFQKNSLIPIFFGFFFIYSYFLNIHIEFRMNYWKK